MKTRVLVLVMFVLGVSLSLGCGRFGGDLGDGGKGGDSPDAPPPPPRPVPLIKPKELLFELPNAVGPLAFSPDGKTLVTCGVAGANQETPILLWDWTGSEPKVRAKLPGHDKCVWAMRFAPDGRTLATCSEDGSVRLWDTTPGSSKLRAKLAWDKGPIEKLCWSGDGKILACSGGDDSNFGANWFIRLWDMSAAEPKEISTFNGGTAVAVSPDGKTLASAWAAEVQLWDLTPNGAVKRATLVGHRKYINALAFSADGKTLASVATDRTIRLWDIAANEERAEMEPYTDQVVHVAWAPNGKLLATAGETNPARIVLWDAAGKQVKQWQVPSTDIYATHIAFSPDNRHLAFPVLTPTRERLVWILKLSSEEK
jgi:WD40 repeat protein